MEFVWNEQKSRRNLAKHGVSFETAKLVFDDPRAVSQLERVKDEEERWQTLGLAGGIMTVSYTHLDVYKRQRPRFPRSPVN